MCRAVSTISFLPFTLLKGLAVPILWMRELRLQRAKETRSGPPLYIMEGFWHQKVCPEQLSSAPAALMLPLLWCLPSPTGPQFPSPVKKKSPLFNFSLSRLQLDNPMFGSQYNRWHHFQHRMFSFKILPSKRPHCVYFSNMFRSQPPKAVIIAHSWLSNSPPCLVAATWAQVALK